ncbi:MAG: serine hydrolase [Gemmatimonadaceae bacterium]|nr:serine hydrolase [Gemmatimonadaceae bacterium]
MTIRTYRTLALAITSALLAAVPGTLTAQARSAIPIARLDSVIAPLFALDLAPGLGVVIVRDTQVLYMKGFGFADVEAKRPFTPQTVFYVASTTKSFTGLATAMLDAQGRFRLDDPIAKYLPEVTWKAPLDPNTITIRSLLAHTHGIGRGPVALRLAYSGEYSGNAQLIGLLAEHEALPDRNYRYTNLGYNIATLAMDKITGESWKATLDHLIFKPLGMRNTSGYVSRVPASSLATPYRSTATGSERIRYGKVDANMQSAGGLVTTLEDEARWLEVNINDGRLDGRQVLPAAAVRETHAVQARFTQNTRGIQVTGYGLGWNIGTLGTDTILVHGGGFPGFATHMSFMPQQKLGIVVFANNGDLGSALVELTAQHLYGVLTGNSPASADSLTALRVQIERQRGAIKADRERRAARPQTLPLPRTAYTGTFTNAAMGTLVLSLNADGSLEARMGSAWSAVEVYDATKNQLRVELFGSGGVMTMNVDGDRVVSVNFEGFTFTRVP